MVGVQCPFGSPRKHPKMVPSKQDTPIGTPLSLESNSKSKCLTLQPTRSSHWLGCPKVLTLLVTHSAADPVPPPGSHPST